MPVREIARAFTESFPLTREGIRSVGREAEYPVVTGEGLAADVRAMWAPLMASPGPTLTPKYEEELITILECEDYTYSLEVGWGTVEVITGPRQDLFGLKAAHEAAMARLYRVAESLDYRILGYGAQPLTPPSAALMSPKARYGVLLEALGDAWYWFTVTASDQVHVDIARPELVSQINLVNLVTPVVVALCGNSPVVGGALSGAMSARESQMGVIHAGSFRHGMPGSAVVDMEDYIRRLAQQPYLVHREGDDWRAVGRPFDEWLAEAPPERRWDDYLLHEHYIWSSGRPRSRIATIELRSACQQPHGSHMAATALGVGIVEAAPLIDTFVREQLGEDPWPAMRAWHHAVIREGLAAPEPAPGLLAGILERCQGALVARGFGEETLLEPLRARLEAGRNPAQEAAAIFEAGGVAALVERAAL